MDQGDENLLEHFLLDRLSQLISTAAAGIIAEHADQWEVASKFQLPGKGSDIWNVFIPFKTDDKT